MPTPAAPPSVYQPAVEVLQNTSSRSLFDPEETPPPAPVLRAKFSELYGPSAPTGEAPQDCVLNASPYTTLPGSVRCRLLKSKFALKAMPPNGWPSLGSFHTTGR